MYTFCVALPGGMLGRIILAFEQPPEIKHVLVFSCGIGEYENSGQRSECSLYAQPSPPSTKYNRNQVSKQFKNAQEQNVVTLFVQVMCLIIRKVEKSSIIKHTAEGVKSQVR